MLAKLLVLSFLPTTRAPAMSIFASVFCLFFCPDVRYITSLRRELHFAAAAALAAQTDLRFRFGVGIGLGTNIISNGPETKEMRGKTRGDPRMVLAEMTFCGW